MTNLDAVERNSGGQALKDEVLQKLEALAEESYKKFSSGLIPTISTDRILGVRIPDLRKMATLMLRDHPLELAEYFQILSEASQSNGCYQEEKLLWGILLSKVRLDDIDRMASYDNFVPAIDNWAVCDIACGSFPWVQKNPDLWLEFFQRYLQCQNEFEIRFGVVMILGNFIKDDTIDWVLDQLSKVNHPAYYVTMALGWTLAECYVRFPEKTEMLLANGSLPTPVQNKTIQKIRESNCVSRENKEHMKGYKR